MQILLPAFGEAEAQHGEQEMRNSNLLVSVYNVLIITGL